MAENIEFLLYTKETAEAIKKAMRQPPIPGEKSYYQAKPKQNLIISSAGRQSEDVAYRGFFKVKKTNNSNGTFNIRIYDGALDIRKGGSGLGDGIAGFCYVNSNRFEVLEFSHDFPSTTTGVQFLLKFDSSADSVSISYIETGRYSDLPFPTSSTAWYLIGTLIPDDDGGSTLIQHHYGGVPQLFWFSDCDSVEENDEN